MQVLQVAHAAHALASQSNTPTSNAAASGSTGSTTGTQGGTAANPLDPTGSLTNEDTFLQLLVAQIKNQDPLNPTDSVQFIGQLVQFSQLEQLLGINQGIQTLVKGGQTSTSSTPPAPSQSGKTTN
jgi:flagellar basal-body rod modification protein FlgD